MLECLVVSAICYGMYILTPYTPVYRAYSHTLYTCVQGGLAHMQPDDLSIVVGLSLTHTHTHAHALQRTATRCDARQHLADMQPDDLIIVVDSLPLSHTHTLQRTATHCNALQRTATHCNALQRTATLHRHGARRPHYRRRLRRNPRPACHPSTAVV